MVQAELKGVVIVCPHCGTRYQLSAETIGGGRLVQCASCQRSWHARVPGGVSFPPFTAEQTDTLFSEDAEAELDETFEAEQRKASEPWLRVVASADAPLGHVAEAAPVTPVSPPDEPTTEQKKTLSKRRLSMRRSLPMNRVRRVVRIGGLLVLAGVIGGGIAFRTEIVRQVPDLAGLYEAVGLGVNVIGLEFRDVRTLRAMRDGEEILSVQARIVGVWPRRVVVPPVVVTLLDDAGRPLYEWSVTPVARDLQAGEAVSLQTSLTAPPASADTVRLTFTNGRARAETPIALPAAAATAETKD